jgi:hypothetical protein
MSNIIYIHTIEYYLTTKNNEVMLHAVKLGMEETYMDETFKHIK